MITLDYTNYDVIIDHTPQLSAPLRAAFCFRTPLQKTLATDLYAIGIDIHIVKQVMYV